MAIRYDKDSNIVTIMINRPEAMNAMDRDTSRELAEAFEDFDQDEDLLVAILTGAGDQAFSAGADLKKMYGRAEDGNIREVWDRDQRLLSGGWAGAGHGLRYSHRLRDRCLRMSRSAVGHPPRLRGFALAKDDPPVGSHGAPPHR